MEAVPRLPMLKVDLKEFQDYSASDWIDTGSTEETVQDAIKEQINKHISDVYSDDPNKYKDCVSNFFELQSSAYRVFNAPDMEGCNTLKKYYGQLHYMQSRFPFTGDDALQVAFIWSDAFTGRFTQQSTFTFEQAAILFNLGAIHSYLGSMDNRTSDEGTKISCVHFQCAAGFFQYITDHLDTTLSPDSSQFMLKLYINTMLGQGQECLLEKSMQDNRKDSIIAKICKQVVEYYEQSLRSLNQSEAKQAMGDANKQWHRLLSFKVAFYNAVTKYYLGCDDWEQEKYGSGLAYFQSAMTSYNDGLKSSKNLKGNFKSRADEALSYSADVFNGRLTSAKKDNEFIYHEKVPDPATLMGAKGASLVKPLPFDPSNSAVTGADIFSKLVPLEAHLTASTYSEEKAKLLRPIVAEVEEKNGVLEQYKRAIEFDIDKLIKIDDEDRLDPSLVEHCAALSVDQTPIQELTKAIKELSNVYMDIDTVISETIAMIEDEENEAKQVKDVCGKTVDSSEEVEKLRRELEMCKDVHEKAAQMNDDLHTAMKVHIDNLKVVSAGLDALKKACNFANTSELITEEDTGVITLMEKLCSKVSEMEIQRLSLVAQLRTQLEEDDVTSALMTNPGIDAEDLFKEELKKHDSVVGYINQNLTAQENILNAVTEANVDYTKVKKVVDNHKKKVQAKCGNFLLSCTDYTAAVKRCEEGTLFFQEVFDKVKETNKNMIKLNEKNSKLRKILIDKYEVKKPPPRPTAPKPKATVAPAIPGTSLFTSEELAAMADEDMDDFNDPAFLKYLRMSGGLPAGMSMPGRTNPMPRPSLHGRGAIVPGGTHVPTHAANLRVSAPPAAVHTPNLPRAQLNHGVPAPHHQPASNAVYHQQHGHGNPALMSSPQRPVLDAQSPQPQFTTLGQHPIMSSQRVPPSQHPAVPQISSIYQNFSNTQQVLPPTSMQPGGNSMNQPHSLPPQHFQQPPAQVGPNPTQGIPTSLPATHQLQKPPQDHGEMLHGQAQPHQNYQQPMQQTIQAANPRFSQPSPNYSSAQQITQPPAQQPQNYMHSTQAHGQLPNPRQQPPLTHPQSTQAPRQPPHNYPQYAQTPGQPLTQRQQQPQNYAQSPGQIPMQRPQQPQNYPQPSQTPGQPAIQRPQVPQNYPQHTQSPGQPPIQGQPAIQRPQVPQNYPQPTQSPGQPPIQRPQVPHNYPQSMQAPGQPPVQRPQVPPTYPQSIQATGQPPIQRSQASQNHPQFTQVPGQPLPQASQPPSNYVQSSQPAAQNASQSHKYPQSMTPAGQPPFHPISQTSRNPQTSLPSGQIMGAQVSPRNIAPRMQQPGHAATQPQNYPAAQAYQRPQVSNYSSSQPSQIGQNRPPPQQQPTSPVAQQFVPRYPQSVQNTTQQAPGAIAQGYQLPTQQYQQQPNQSIPRNQEMPRQPLQNPIQAVNQPGRHQNMPATQNPQQQQIMQASRPLAPQQGRFPGPTPHNFSGQSRQQAPVSQTQYLPSNQPNPAGNIANQTAYHQQQLRGPPVSQNPQAVNPMREAVPQHQPPSRYPATNPSAHLPTQQPPAQTGLTAGPLSPQLANPPAGATQVQGSRIMPEPIMPTVVEGAKLSDPLQPNRPSADLEGLTYIPSGEIMRPKMTNTSADELLTASPEPDPTIVRESKSLLVPTKVDNEEIVVTRIDDDLPYKNEADLMKFKGDSETFHKQISTLLVKRPGSLCQLDKDWKQLSELQEKAARQQSTAVGRCSSYKNRFQDILPFDQNRVVLNEGKDDYINASLVDGINKYCPRFIATQSPLASSCGDFWTMILEQNVTLVVMLVGNNEIPKKCAKYWPEARNEEQKYGPISITFTTSRVHSNYVERRFTLKHAKSSLPRSLTQLQYTSWPEHGQPSSLQDLVSFMDVVSSFHVQQRSLQWPVVVHCENGVGHTGTFCSTYACIKYVDAGLGVPDVLEIVEKIRTKRKYMLQEKAQLKFVYDLVSIRAVELLKQRGVMVDNQPPANQMIASPPPVNNKSNFDVFGSSALSSIQASVNKMTVKIQPASQLQTPVSNASEPSQTTDAHSLADINTMIGSNVSDLVQGTITVQPIADPATSCVTPDVISNCKEPVSTSSNTQPLSSDLSGKTQPEALSPANFSTPLPTNPASINQDPINPSIPRNASLLEQLTPESFTLGTEVKEKKRFTKADFFKPNSGIEAKTNANDPFAGLDPMWGLKK